MNVSYRLDRVVAGTHLSDSIARFLARVIGEDYAATRLVVVVMKSQISFTHLFVAVSLYRKCFLTYRSQVREEHVRTHPELRFATFTRKDDLDALMCDRFLLFVVALVIGSKILDDSVYTNACWSELCSIPHATLGSGERCLLGLLAWEIEPPECEVLCIIKEFEAVNDGAVSSAPQRSWFMKRMLACISSVLRCVGLE